MGENEPEGPKSWGGAFGYSIDPARARAAEALKLEHKLKAEA